MSKIFKRGPASAEMNMTPLIDVTFQLIIFFMLVNNIISTENVEMVIPDLEQPKTRALGEIEKVTVNVAPMPYVRQDRMSGNPLNFPGEAAYVQIGMDQYPPNELDTLVAQLKDVKARNPKVEVLLRADAALNYQAMQPIMDAINAAGIATVNLVAVIPEDDEAAAANARDAAAAAAAAGNSGGLP